MPGPPRRRGRTAKRGRETRRNSPLPANRTGQTAHGHSRFSHIQTDGRPTSSCELVGRPFLIWRIVKPSAAVPPSRPRWPSCSSAPSSACHLSGRRPSPPPHHLREEPPDEPVGVLHRGLLPEAVGLAKVELDAAEGDRDLRVPRELLAPVRRDARQRSALR